MGFQPEARFRAHASAVAVALVLVACLAACGDDPSGAAGTERGAEAGTSPAATAPLGPAPTVLPSTIPGYRVDEVGIGSFRESNVFRLRNALLNGLEGGASSYSFTTNEAAGQGTTSLLFGVAARQGAMVPDVPAAINRLIAPVPSARARACGRPVSFHGAAESQTLTVLDVGERRALVALATDRASAERVVEAAAQAILGDC